MFAMDLLLLVEDMVGLKVLPLHRTVLYRLNEHINSLPMQETLNNSLDLNVVGPVDPVISDLGPALNPIGVNHKSLNSRNTKVVSEQVNMLPQDPSAVNPRTATLVVVDPWEVDRRSLVSLKECQVDSVSIPCTLNKAEDCHLF